MAKTRSDAPNDVIKSWMHSKSTLGYLLAWELLYTTNILNRSARTCLMVSLKYKNNLWKIHTPCILQHRMLIGNWMRQKPIIEYLGLWESLENDNFNVIGFDDIKNQAGSNAFILSPIRWVQQTNAIGIIPGKPGR